MAVHPTRDRLHAIVDALPEGDLAGAEQLLESFSSADPALRTAFVAPIDDEPLSVEQMRAIDVSRLEITRGEVISDDDLDDFLAQHSK